MAATKRPARALIARRGPASESQLARGRMLARIPHTAARDVNGTPAQTALGPKSRSFRQGGTGTSPSAHWPLGKAPKQPPWLTGIENETTVQNLVAKK